MTRLRGSVRRPDGARIAFQLEGPRDAPALLLLQGQANSHRWWRRLRGAFAAERLTVTFDYRGTGATEASLDDGPAWSTEGFADDAAAVAAALGRESVDVYATSMGGRVAQELVLRHPVLVHRLVLACTSSGGAGAVEREQDVRRALADPDASKRLATTADLFYSPAFVAARGGVDHVPTDLFGDPLSALAGRRHLAVSTRHDAWDRLPDVTVPTLVLHGADDRMTPPVNAERIAGRIPGARARILPGRHGFFDEHADAVAPLVRDFLG